MASNKLGISKVESSGCVVSGIVAMISSLEQIRNRLRMRHLQLLHRLAESGSLRKAAESMALTQPAVTKTLQELEGLVGEPLFQRTSHGLIPNPLGEAAIRYAQLVYADLGHFHEEVCALKSGNLGKIRIGSMGSLSGTLIPRSISRLQQSHPKLGISVMVDTSDVLLQELERGQLDLLVARIPFGWMRESLDFEPFGEELIQIVARKEHPEMTNPNATLETLSHYPWVVQSHPTPLREIFDQIFREAQVSAPSSLVETASTILTFSLVQQTNMIALMPLSLLDFYRSIGTLERLPVPLSVHLTSYGLISRKGRPPTFSMLAVSEAIRKEFESLR
jgi:DNA-binding transcriptional LysR family regulator